MKTDPNTGLPETPEGYFFKVENIYGSGIYSEPYTKVSLVKAATKPGHRFKAFWFEGEYADHEKGYYSFSDGRVLSTSEEGGMSYDEAIKHLIRRAADKLLEDHAEELQKREIQRTLEKYAGSYPPKKL